MRLLTRNHDERGQAVVLIAAAALALMGMLAVVVDVGHLYVEERKMQQAADAAAAAGAQNWLSAGAQLNVSQAVADARTYASLNGYTTNSGAGNGQWDPVQDSGVLVSIPPSTGAYSNSVQYVEVIISKPITTFFASIFNVSTVQVTARAVARGISGSLNASVIALGTSIDAVTTSGSSSTNIYGNLYSAGGIKCNSGNIRAYYGGAYAVGGFGANCLSGQLQADYGLNIPPPTIFDPQWPSFESEAPSGPGGNWTCQGHWPEGDGYIHIPAGTYNSITVDPGCSVMFDGGVYHLLGEGDSPALTIQGNVVTKGGEALQFVLEGGAIHFEAQATGSLTSGPQYNDILIYSKRSDGGNAIQIVGGASLAYNGTIYAPSANIALSGNSSAIINGQVIAKTITLGGSSGTAINWDGSRAPVTIAPRLTE